MTRKDKIRNEYIRGTVKVERLGMKMREGKLRWYVWTCHEKRPEVCRKKGDGNGVTGKEKNREAKEKISRCTVVKENVGEVGAREKDIENIIGYGNL